MLAIRLIKKSDVPQDFLERFRVIKNEILILGKKMAQSSAICDFGWKAPQFSLPSTKGIDVSLKSTSGNNGTLVMFICNHCPYVVGALDDIVQEASALQNIGVNVLAICSNDAEEYPQDNFENMKKFDLDYSFTFPYLHDADQSVAKKFNAECTPDFFGFNSKLELQYRGRLNNKRENPEVVKRDLFEAMNMIAKTGQGPQKQSPSIGCSIKWKSE